MIVYLVCYAASLLLALGRHYLLSGAGLLAAAAPVRPGLSENRLYPEWKSSASAGDFRSFLCRWTGTGVYEA